MHDKADPIHHRGLDGVQKMLIFGGFFAFLGACGAAFGGVDLFLETCVKFFVELSKDNMMWGYWKEFSVPMFYKFYIFNVTNAERLKLGEKPKLEEIGPYTYMAKLTKKDITVNIKADSIKYRQPRKLYFQNHLSVGKETDKVTTINMLFLAVANMAHSGNYTPSMMQKLDTSLTEAGETLTATNTVRQLLLTGVSIEPYVDAINDFGGGMELSEKFADGKFAAFKGKDGSDDGWWVVKSGIRNYRELSRIITINGKKKLSIWKQNFCNMLNGTDGLLYPPFIIPGVTKLPVYSTDLCRSFNWKFSNTTIHRGVFSARYFLPEFLTPEENPDNWCFCPKEDPLECNISGMLSLESCYGGVPIMATKPHFYGVDPKIVKKVVGLSPSKDKHESKLEVHAYTGFILESFFRIQLAVELIKWPDMPSFGNCTRAWVPLAWMEQHIRQDGVNTGFIRILETFRRAWPTLRFIIVLMALGIVVGGFALVYKSRTSNEYDEDELIGKTNIDVLARDFAAGFGDKYATQYNAD